MKLLQITVLSAALSILAIGCTTTTNSTTGVKTTVANPALIQVTAQEVAMVGASLDLQQRPQDAASFDLASQSLKAFVAAGTGSAGDLQRILQALPISQLQGNSGKLIVGASVGLITTGGQYLVQLDQGQAFSNYLKPLAQGVAMGLDQALAAAK